MITDPRAGEPPGPILAELRALLEQHGAAHPPPACTEAFWLALATLPARGVPAGLAARAVRAWSTLLAPYAPPEASIEPTAEGLRFTWSLDALYLHVDVLEAGGYGWFLRDHRAGSYEGAAVGPEPELPAAFFRALVAVRARVEATGLSEG